MNFLRRVELTQNNDLFKMNRKKEGKNVLARGTEYLSDFLQELLNYSLFQFIWRFFFVR